MRFPGMLALVALCAVGWMTGCTPDEPPPRPPEPEVVRKTIEPPPNPAGKGSKTEDGGPARSPEPEETGVPVAEAAAGEPMEAQGESAVTASGAETASTGGPAEPRAAADAEPAEEGYLVQPGDSLAVVAGREDVFGDPLKWPVLYQLNREKLSGMTLDARLPERPLPEGIRVRYRLGAEEGERAGPRTKQTWVVNVISSPTADRIDGPAAKLLKRGYPVYISRAMVKGQKWMRLRVGFYDNREAALKAGGKLQEILGQEDSWPVRIGPEETEEFADLMIPLRGGEG